MKIAFVFPGQEPQHVGMGKSLYENFDEVKTLYKEASNALGYDIADLSFNGPAEESLTRLIEPSRVFLRRAWQHTQP